MEDVTNSKLSNKTIEGIKAYLAMAEKKLAQHKELRAAVAGKHPRLDGLIGRCEGYIRRRGIDKFLLENPGDSQD